MITLVTNMTTRITIALLMYINYMNKNSNILATIQNTFILRTMVIIIPIIISIINRSIMLKLRIRAVMIIAIQETPIRPPKLPWRSPGTANLCARGHHGASLN